MFFVKLIYVFKFLMSAIIPATLVSIFHSSSSPSSTQSSMRGKVNSNIKQQQNLNVNNNPPTSKHSIEDAIDNNGNIPFQPNPMNPFGSPICPGSPALKNAKCIMTITFPKPTTCSMVQTEITSRMNGLNGWVDPHNQGVYKILNDHFNFEEQMTQITGSRVTGNASSNVDGNDGKTYEDLFIFTLEDDTSSNGNGGCILNACSESQVLSVVDFSTNYCNLRNLYCNKNDGCPIFKYNLNYQETYIDCWQKEATSCIA